jgi:predicted ArsR family transcriptional regulator
MVDNMDTLKFQEESTRKLVLQLLKRQGNADAKTIAKFCGLTTMAVGRHLLKLSSEGLIQSRLERRPRGRPAAVHSLTEQGDGHFPRDYAGVATEVLASLVQLDGPEKVKQVFRQRRGTMEAGYRGRTKGKGFEQRVRAVAAVLTECGYMAEVESMNPGEFLLTLGNCAIRDVAKRFPEACDEELCLVRNLVNAKVTRVSHLLAGDRHCSYRICPKGRRKGNSAGQTASDEDDV